MKKTKKLSAMLLASLISVGTVSSLSAGAMHYGTGYEYLDKMLDGYMEIPASETELFGKSYMPQYPDATYFVGHTGTRLVDSIESSSLDIWISADTDIEDVKKIISEICPDAIVSKGSRNSESWTEIDVKGYEGKIPYSEAKKKYISLNKSKELYKALSEITLIGKFNLWEKEVTCVRIGGHLTGYMDGVLTDIDGTTYEFLCRDQIEKYIADNYPEWHVNLEYGDYQEFNPMDYSIEPNNGEATIEEHYKIANEIYKLTGYIPESSSTAYESDSTISGAKVDLHTNVKGDANDDGKLALSDAVAIMQTVGNPDTYGLTAQGEYNADIAGDFDGITNLDALTVQRKLLKLE